MLFTVDYFTFFLPRSVYLILKLLYIFQWYIQRFHKPIKLLVIMLLGVKTQSGQFGSGCGN